MGIKSAFIFGSFLLFVCLIPAFEAQSVNTANESISTYKTTNSAIYNANDVRDGIVGVNNQAQLEAKSCGSTCTPDSYAGLYLEIELQPEDTMVNISIVYESWAEDAGLGETIPSQYQMSVYINHKFSDDFFLIEETTTGYGNYRNVFIGSFAPPENNNTITIDYFLLHSDTNSLHDQVSARVHEIYIEEGPADSDNDGVADSEDQCETSLSDVSNVDSTGCVEGNQSTDSDNDGVNDDLDNCPNTNQNEEVNQDGCSPSQLDSDSDGISDENDQCPGTLSGDEVNFSGCSESQSDTDGDGVNDLDDACPGTENGAQVNMLGCSEAQLEQDDDGDGVPNSIDDCPDSPTEAVVEVNGCEVVLSDSDGDGYFDETNDKFPNDGSQWNDSDDDGYGDNQFGLNPDSCPNQFGLSFIDKYGCLDTDQDGYSDEGDSFVQNPTQWADLDGDGYGDNSTGTNPDMFPDDITQWLDTDGDGYGDNAEGTNPDSCVGTIGTSFTDRFGCPDNDGDGVSNAIDDCQNSLSSDGFVDEIGCTSKQKDSDMDGVSNSEDICPQTPAGTEVLPNGCASSASGEEDSVKGFQGMVKDNLNVIVGTTLAGLGSLIGYIIFRRRSARSVKYLQLAKLASDLDEIQDIRDSIERDLSKGRMDPIVHSRIDSILDERTQLIVERMSSTVQK